MSIPASTARANLFPLIKKVKEDQEAVLITSNGEHVRDAVPVIDAGKSRLVVEIYRASRSRRDT